jgi:methylmalonyl-CoA mutase N-terminal domain/subunit
VKTRSGIEIAPLYGPEDVRTVPPPPGEFPYTRGIHRNMYLGKLWTMRQYAGFGTPSETNERFRYLLGQGQTGLSLALDLPTQLGLDADDPEAEGEVGKVGVSIGSLADMEQLFAGIPLGKVSCSMTINATAPILLALYESAAVKQGVPPDRISGTVQNDLLKEFGARGAWLYPIEASMRLACDLVEDTVKRLPRFNPISIASHYRDAGATPAEEAAYTLSAGKAYVENLLVRGLPPDSFAPRLSFFFYTYTNFFEEARSIAPRAASGRSSCATSMAPRSRRAGGCGRPASAAAIR